MAALQRLALLDSPAEVAFDDVVAFAADQLGVTMAAISLVDARRQWFKSSIGLGITHTDRDIALCNVVVQDDAELVVVDTLADPRFADNPLVVDGPRIRFYAGVPIHAFGEAIGTLCVLDEQPRALAADDLTTLRFLAQQVEHLVDLHARRSAELPPPRNVVALIADRITDGDDFHITTGGIHRPAWVYDTATLRFLAVNDSAVEQYGWTPEQFADRTILDIRPPSDRGVLSAVVATDAVDEYVSSRLWRHRRADGQHIDVKITSAPTVWHGKPARLVVATDVTAQIAMADALERAAHVDSLTGLANRREFIRTLAQRLAGTADTVAVLFVDLDRFKLVNDTIGHDAGDALLGAAAARIRSCTPSIELVARLGGDEFAVIRAVSDAIEAQSFAEVLRASLERPFVIEGCEYYVSASVGVAISEAASTPQSLLSEADAAMYAAKDAGRNGFAVFDHDLRQQMTEWSAIQRDLHRAIEHHEVVLDLQPIVYSRSGTVVHEALARWNHPERGRLAPAAFIQVAEESGLIVRLGAHLLGLGAAHAAELGTAVSVNVSVRQFNRTLVQQVGSLIERFGLARGQLVIEITESAVVDTDHARIVLEGLREVGAEVWIDDFGTGFSSLARLSSLTVDGLKLAGQFVADLDSPRGWGIATAIVGIGRSLGIDVIAEGVETERQLAQVRELGCDAVQGFLIGRPQRVAGVIDRSHRTTETSVCVSGS